MVAAVGAAPDRLRPVFIRGGGVGVRRWVVILLGVVAVAALIVAVFM